MAFPWPLLAAGISFLPKPGGWMVHVKHLFGFLIILMGIYYGIQSWKILFPETEDNPATLQEVLVLSKESGKPVFVDFYADWCKNCIAMEKTVFQDPDVKAKLEAYEFIKIDATNTHDPRIRKLLDQYDIRGLPAYLILKAE